MFQLIFRVTKKDVYPIVVYPHQTRGLKKNEILIFETESAQDFEKKFKNICKACVQLHGEITDYLDK